MTKQLFFRIWSRIVCGRFDEYLASGNIEIKHPLLTFILRDSRNTLNFRLIIGKLLLSFSYNIHTDKVITQVFFGGSRICRMARSSNA